MKKYHQRWRWNRAINCYTACTAYNAYITIKQYQLFEAFP